jgi:3-carboxy-cis,cis-muconate cycloisomerase
VELAIDGGDLATAVRALPETTGLDVDALLNPAEYTGLAGTLTDGIASAPRREP